MAERISKATGFSVSIESLRPDIAEMFREQGATHMETPNGTEAPETNTTGAVHGELAPQHSQAA